MGIQKSDEDVSGEGGGELVCPLRMAGYPYAPGMDKDAWRVEANGERACSFCGSMHPEDFQAFLETVDGMERWVELADGRHKVYVRRLEVRRQMRWPIKFYLAHYPDGETYGALNKALALSYDKMEERTDALMAPATGKDGT